MQHKRAQSEILGFVMVVLIVSVALLFVIVLTFSQAQSTIREDFTDAQIAINLNKAILETSTSCRNIKMKDLLSDCAESQLISCGSAGSSCDFIKAEIPQLLNKTVGSWGQVYIFDVEIRSRTTDALPRKLFNVSSKDAYAICRRSQITPGTFLLPLRSGEVVYQTLRICREG